MKSMPVHNPLGRPPKYTPKQLVEKFEEYVKWSEEHPYTDDSKVTYANGNYAASSAAKPRRLSIAAFQLYVGCSDTWWEDLDKSKNYGKEFTAVKTYIKKYCETSQTNMASAGLLKENIISRLLGLADKQQVDGQVEFKFKFGE